MHAARFSNVDICQVGMIAPPVVMSSSELEEKLRPLYERLHLPEGRLELMTGIRTRHFWKPGMLPSDAAALAGEAVLQKSGMAKAELGALVFCAVSHDFVEPATSTAVVRKLGLPADIINFDISNACLGMVSGILTLANMIELGQIECGLAVTGENAGPLVENTVSRLNADLTLTRKSIKDEFASLTIGSAAAAVLVTRHGLFSGKRGHKLLTVASASECRNNRLCQGDAAGGMIEGSAPVMKTDSHELMIQGIEVASRMWQALMASSGWEKGLLPECVCGHQVGKIHRDMLFERLGLPLALDFPVFPDFGNCGSASLPMACALAEEQGVLRPGMRLAMLGIGSGINSMGMTVDW